MEAPASYAGKFIECSLGIREVLERLYPRDRKYITSQSRCTLYEANARFRYVGDVGGAVRRRRARKSPGSAIEIDFIPNHLRDLFASLPRQRQHLNDTAISSTYLPCRPNYGR